VADLNILPLGARIENALTTYAVYIEKILWPSHLAPFYPFPKEQDFGLMILAASLLAATSITCLVLGKKAPYLITGWLWYLGTLIPVIGLVHVGLQSHADRYTYIPSVGVFILIVWVVTELTMALRRQDIVLTLALFTTCVPCIGLTIARVKRWRDSETLFRYCLLVTKNNFIAHQNVGAVLVEKGKLEEAEDQFSAATQIKPDFAESQSDLGLALVLQGKVDEGIAHYQAALATGRPLDKTHYNLGLALSKKHRQEEAKSEFGLAIHLNSKYADARRALAELLIDTKNYTEAAIQLEALIKLNDRDVVSRYNLATIYRIQGNFPGAIEELKALLHVAPNDAQALEDLGQLLGERGQISSAIDCLSRSATLKPSGEIHYKLGLAYAINKQSAEAVSQYRLALKLKPHWAEALNDLAWILATTPQSDLRNGSEAVKLAREACEIAGGTEPRFLGTLDAAYAESGAFEQAIKGAENTIEVSQAKGFAEICEAAKQRLELYRSMRPFRQK
jgi:tetratricopeptide (TPR) repeat protein